MQNRAAINLFLDVRLCVHYTVNAFVGPSMQFYEDKQTRRDRLNSLLKCSISRNLMFLIDRNGHYNM